MLRGLICHGVYYFMCLYTCVCTMLRGLMCQGVHYFMCLYVCTMLRGLICQGVYYFMCLYVGVYYVKRVNMSRSPLFHMFI